MALTFGAASTHRVNHGSNSVIDDLNPLTLIMWVYCTTRTSGRYIFNKGANPAKNLLLSGGTGNIEWVVDRATTDADYITSDTPLTANVWTYIAITFDSAATPSSRIYTGKRATAAVESTYGTSTSGSGSVTSDAANSFIVGNSSGLNAAFQGSIADVRYFNRALTLGECIDQQFNPHMDSGCKLYCVYGFNGTGTQPDWSGNANSGAVTGATLAVVHPPVAYFPLHDGMPMIAPPVPGVGHPAMRRFGGIKHGRELIGARGVKVF